MDGQVQAGEMVWKVPGSEETLLRLRWKDGDEWRAYTEFPELMEPDVEEMSLGYPTFIKLLKSGWKLL